MKHIHDHWYNHDGRTNMRLRLIFHIYLWVRWQTRGYFLSLPKSRKIKEAKKVFLKSQKCLCAVMRSCPVAFAHTTLQAILIPVADILYVAFGTKTNLDRPSPWVLPLKRLSTHMIGAYDPEQKVWR